jgi:hypothetical protein
MPSYLDFVRSHTSTSGSTHCSSTRATSGGRSSSLPQSRLSVRFLIRERITMPNPRVMESNVPGMEPPASNISYKDQARSLEELCNDIVGENDNDFFGGSLDISDDGTILAVGSTRFDGAAGTNTGRCCCPNTAVSTVVWLTHFVVSVP